MLTFSFIALMKGIEFQNELISSQIQWLNGMENAGMQFINCSKIEEREHQSGNNSANQNVSLMLICDNSL